MTFFFYFDGLGRQRKEKGVMVYCVYVYICLAQSSQVGYLVYIRSLRQQTESPASCWYHNFILVIVICESV